MKTATIKIIVSMTIFGTIGIFVRLIPVDGAFLAMLRGIIGALFLVCVGLAIRKPPSMAAVRKNFFLLLLSGASLGFNWILLFESYSHTTIANATLCYYMAPVFVVALSPFVIGERVGAAKWLCVLISMLGMVLVSLSSLSVGGMAGIFLALGAAALYALATLITKRLSSILPRDVTVFQLFFAALCVAPYALVNLQKTDISLGLNVIVMIIFVGVVHTGLAYLLFFSAVERLSGASVAVLSYIDPIVALFVSIIILKEEFSFLTIIGAILIIISAVVSEIPNFRAKKKG